MIEELARFCFCFYQGMTHCDKDPSEETTLPSRSDTPTSRGGCIPPPPQTPDPVSLDSGALVGLHTNIITKVEVLCDTLNNLDVKVQQLTVMIQNQDDDDSVDEILQELAKVLREVRALNKKVNQLGYRKAPMSKPRLLHPLDAILLAVPGLSLLTLGGFALKHHLTGALGAILVGVGLLVAWLRLALLRKRLVESYPIVTKYRVLIKHNGYHITRAQAEDAIARMLKQYTLHWLDAERVLTQEFTWVEFVPGVVEEVAGGKPMKVAGVLRVGGRHVRVGFHNDQKEPDNTVSLHSTTFTHELGHIILGGVLGSDPSTNLVDPWDEKLHHSIMSKFGLLRTSDCLP